MQNIQNTQNTQDIKKIAFEHVKNIKDSEKGLFLMPTRATSKSAGYDFFLPFIYETTTIKSKETFVFKTGIKAKMLDGMYLKIVPRSSIGIKKTLFVTNTLGIIDSDYYSNTKNDGEIYISLYNFGKNASTISPGEAVVQGIFSAYYVTDDDYTTNKRNDVNSWISSVM